MTVKQLAENMTANELAEWVAYDRLDPIGGYRQDIQTAHLLYAKIGGKGKTVRDFLPVDPEPMTDEQRREMQIQQRKAEIARDVEQMRAMFDKM